MEAMSCGCAIVTTENCMIPEVVEHGVNGFMSNNPNELREYCQLLLNDKALAATMGSAARKTIVEKYSLESFIKNWSNLFDEASKITFKGF
jgi:glycosyltransferase involved in cell wall biosynthesis